MSGITSGAEWSTTLQAGSWTPIPDTGAGSGFLGTGGFVGSLGEIAPVPEPATIFAALGLLGLAGGSRRRRVRHA